MTDSKRLRSWIEDRGYKFKAIAKALGISAYTLQKKIDNETEFKASEIMAFVDKFGMSTADRDLIFFTLNVD